jgi:hypothetical protein
VAGVLLPVMLLSGALGGLGGLPVLAGHDLAVLGVWAVAGLLASVRLFRWEPQPPGHATRPGPDR